MKLCDFITDNIPAHARLSKDTTVTTLRSIQELTRTVRNILNMYHVHTHVYTHTHTHTYTHNRAYKNYVYTCTYICTHAYTRLTMEITVMTPAPTQ